MGVDCSAHVAPPAEESGPTAEPTTSSGPTCRFCLDEVSEASLHAADEETRVVSPCACKGTAALVHVACLRRWQAALLGRRLTRQSIARATLCPVCQEPLVIDGEVLEPAVSPDVGMVQPGTLLVSTQNLEGVGRPFHHSVILLTDVDPNGRIRGMDMTRLVPSNEAALADALAAPAVKACREQRQVRVLAGGPVNGGRFGVIKYAFLSTCDTIWAAEQVLPSEGGRPGLFAPHPWVNLSVEAAAQGVRRFCSQDSGAATDHKHYLIIFKGHAAWGCGQLQGEIQRGNWELCMATMDDIAATPPGELWATLRASGRLRHSR
eukprot:TRINITY_DN81054_c0_g1_i1.p1 TRINITY_DN81054_c0_g1~~TRINITY_DN81054_c0_g1_i1.p1  ORF type:complete len:321 (+),score=30.09 TRINITY_DN81054_c0_g1_i1:157-1119(+)